MEVLKGGYSRVLVIVKFETPISGVVKKLEFL
jgi:hypothetical protein